MTPLYKITFLMSLMVGTLITISSNSWLGMWMGLEINLLSIIPLMISKTNPRSSEAALKYFITQALASIVLLTSILMINSQSWINSSLNIISTPDMLMTMSLLMKTGAAPLHFWFPEVITGASWNNALILLTWQKIAPMILLMNSKLPMMMTISILMSVIIGSIMGLNQTSLRKIMAFSSINHMGWMLAIMLFAEKIWLLYFTIYSVMNVLMIRMFSLYKMSQMSQIPMIMQFNPYLKIIFMMNFLSLGGTPPFIGFLPKWMVVQSLINNQAYLMSLIIILMALITLYYYLRIAMTSFLFSNPPVTINFKLNKPEEKAFLTINTLVLMSLITYTMTFSLN
uniref:NADH-ubiquinone oxidoreductase chain 2 n=1 Tax=Trachys variolaris TaxID=2823040 RepID=A0A8A6W4G4_9COLE|nr:NADH dehydrogenase subunit 2 [Trachys variolaris]QTK22436.1 NADH dehydrogenase subunit 2 [Trachys variolaris]